MFKVFQELSFYSHLTFQAHLLGLLGQHIFPMPVSFGLLVVPLPLSVRVFRLELITTSSTRRANQEEKNMIKKTI